MTRGMGTGWAVPVGIWPTALAGTGSSVMGGLGLRSNTGHSLHEGRGGVAGRGVGVTSQVILAARCERCLAVVVGVTRMLS